MDKVDEAIVTAWPDPPDWREVPYSARMGDMLRAVANATACELTPGELWERLIALRDRGEIVFRER